VLLVASPATRGESLGTMRRLGYACGERDDPYAAMAELCRRPMVYRAVILSLASLYREELAVISAIKRRFSYLEIWVTHTDGRQAALAEAMRLGAEGILSEDGLHRIGVAAPDTTPAAPPDDRDREAAANPEIARVDRPEHDATEDDDESLAGEPVLTADELRALLHEQPATPPAAGSEG
jgi:hypothetical protein